MPAPDPDDIEPSPPAGAGEEPDIPIDLGDESPPHIDLDDLDVDLGGEDEGSGAGEGASTGTGAGTGGTARTLGAGPIGLEPARVPGRPERSAKASPRSIDRVCPNCGADKPDPTDMLCLRCGFDMKTLKVVSTRTGSVSPEEEADAGAGAAIDVPPVSRPGRGGQRLPLIMAAVAGGLLLLGHLFGAAGLFPHHLAGEGFATSVSFGDRLKGLWDAIVLVCIWWLCGLAGLVGLAGMLKARFGDVRLAGARVLAIIVTMRLATFIDVKLASWERLLEIPLQMAIFVGLSTFLFSLKWRDSVLYMLIAMAGFLVLWLVAMFLHGATFGPGA